MPKRTRPKKAPPRVHPPQASAPAVHAGGGGAGAGKPDQLTICTQHCGARCCRYITVGIPAPKSVDDWDEVRWWLAHEEVMVTHDDDGWMVHFRTRCQNLKADNACAVYPDHMLCCQAYDPTDCEYTGEVPFDVQFLKQTDLADYLERRRLKRGKVVAQAIRRAEVRLKQARSGAGGGLVALVGLTPLPRADDAAPR
jgi:Fe-S-cluster containining protein